jgi:hypothetical protein
MKGDQSKLQAQKPNWAQTTTVMGADILVAKNYEKYIKGIINEKVTEKMRGRKNWTEQCER